MSNPEDPRYPAARGLNLREPLLFERSSPGRTASPPGPAGVAEEAGGRIPTAFLRDGIEGFPELSELDLVRHYVRLSQQNFSVDTTFYPLGSCTMKYNPKVNERAARLPGFAGLHPYAPEAWSQGALALLSELEGMLAEVSGMEAVTLAPAAGAHGEFTGMLLVRAYHRERGDGRRKVLLPDTAHGTNPASSALAGFEVEELHADERGILSAREVARAMDDSVAALMLTNPNTLGLFEEEILEIARIVHDRGGLLYGDGANLNAILGRARPGDLGFDVLQFNLHKTFSTPHGGGGPGSGPVGVRAPLAPYLPVPRVVAGSGGYALSEAYPKSIGRIRSFAGSFLTLVRAYAYLRGVGGEGLKRIAEAAVLNANYLRTRLRKSFHVPFDRSCMHEFVLSDRNQSASGVKTLDIAKRLLDFGFHPPTIYFPLVVSGAMMIEPTETESPETLDAFASALEAIAEEARTNPETVRNAPHSTRVGRLDEVKAAREIVLRWGDPAGGQSPRATSRRSGKTEK